MTSCSSGSPASQPAGRHSSTLALCTELGFPVAEDKTEGPTSVLTFLGIEVDTIQQQVRLPQDKLLHLTSNVASWMRRTARPMPRRSAKKRDLLSLLGLLHHVASVVRPGRAFLRSLINAAARVQDLDHRVHLDSSARADLAWWHTFLGTWNGTSTMPPTNLPLSDAFGTWGCGACVFPKTSSFVCRLLLFQPSYHQNYESWCSVATSIGHRPAGCRC